MSRRRPDAILAGKHGGSLPSNAAAAYVGVDGHENKRLSSTHLSHARFGRHLAGTAAGIRTAVLSRCPRRPRPQRFAVRGYGKRRPTFRLTMGHWQFAAAQFLPTSAVRDLTVHGNDLVACTYGRAFWVLTMSPPLRQISTRVANQRHTFSEPAHADSSALDDKPGTPFPPRCLGQPTSDRRDH